MKVDVNNLANPNSNCLALFWPNLSKCMFKDIEKLS